MKKESPRILVVGPFMHRKGHFATFPADLARGFLLNGATVTLLHPLEAVEHQFISSDINSVCLVQQTHKFNALMKLVWQTLQGRPILLCLSWIILNTRKGDYDLVYWTDFEPDNQQSTWPLCLSSLVGLYRHRTAFTEHHNFNWSRHRLQRLLRLDRLRLRHMEMFVHSKRLLAWIRLNMRWPDKGHYLPWGLWPDQVNDEERAEARDILGISHDSRVLLVFGMQAIRRKNIDTLAEALRDITLSVPLFILFVGKKIRDEPHPFDDPSLVKKDNLHVRHIEDFVPNDRVRLYFAAADAVWAYYGDFLGASGVFAQAIAYARIPICAAASESGELCKTYNVGLPTPTDDVAGVRAVLLRFLGMERSLQTIMEAATRGAAAAMSWPNIARAIMDVTFAGQSVDDNTQSMNHASRS